MPGGISKMKCYNKPPRFRLVRVTRTSFSVNSDEICFTYGLLFLSEILSCPSWGAYFWDMCITRFNVFVHLTLKSKFRAVYLNISWRFCFELRSVFSGWINHLLASSSELLKKNVISSYLSTCCSLKSFNDTLIT